MLWLGFGQIVGVNAVMSLLYRAGSPGREAAVMGYRSLDSLLLRLLDGFWGSS